MFYVVATPIGNLEDITYRAVRILKEVDIILCEDTRSSKVLLNKYEIKTKTESYHTHSKDSKNDKIINYLKEGKNIALISDAGTPCISDPGVKLISDIREYISLNEESDIKIVAVPGPAAFTALMSISGVYSDSFTFYGFVPHKKGRQTMLREMLANQNASIVYESTHRIEKLMQEIYEQEIDLKKECMKNNLEYINRKIVIGRELTKMFEEVLSGDATEILEIFKKDNNKLRGEFVVMIV